MTIHSACSSLSDDVRIIDDSAVKSIVEKLIHIKKIKLIAPLSKMKLRENKTIKNSKQLVKCSHSCCYQRLSFLVTHFENT